MSDFSVTVNISKGRDGYQAKTRIKLPGVTPVVCKGNMGNGKVGETVLDITTGKASGKGISTFASVSFLDNQGFLSMALAQDYSKRIAQSDARCTEKSVKALHEAALGTLSTILLDVKAYYAERGLYTEPAAAEPVAQEGGAS